MNDCPNAVIRDQLPDLLHERLDASARAAVMAHVDGCVDCREELDVLRGVHEMLVSRSPRIDVRSIVAALPKPPVAQPQSVELEVAQAKVIAIRPASRRRVWSDWRVAAAVVLFVAGGSSVVLLRQTPVPAASDILSEVTLPPANGAVPVGSPDSAPVVVKTNTASTSVATSQQTIPAETVASATTGQGNAEIGVSGHLADLDDGQLEALLNDIDHIEAVPITDPEPVAIKIDSRAPATGRGRGT
jgi:hypothetical protein